MQQKGVDPLGTQVLERTGERLLNLNRDRGLGIVRQAMILPATECKFGLQEKVIASHDPSLN